MTHQEELIRRGWILVLWFETNNVRLIAWNKKEYKEFNGATIKDVLEKAMLECTENEAEL